MGNSVLTKRKQWLAGVLSGVFMLAAPSLALAGALIPNNEKPSGPTIPYSSFVDDVKAGQADEVIVTGSQAKMLLGGAWIQTEVPDSENVYQTLKGSKDSSGREITIAAEQSDEIPTEFLSSIMSSFLVGGAIVGAAVIMRRGIQTASPSANNKKSPVLNDDPGKRVTFADVAGIDEAKEDLEDIVHALRNPAKYRSMGAKMPKGVLLSGPPGTGKTLLARAIAGEANVPFFSMSGSDFVEKYVGVGAARVRELAEEGKKRAPCIIFIDEIDAVGRQRSNESGGNDERENTLNALLTEMDGFGGDSGITWIAATNRPDILDEALMRPGRFDRQVVVPNPDILGREKILRVHMWKVRLADDVNPTVIARGTPGFSGAALANLVNEAALLAVKAGKQKSGMAEFERAKDKILMGAERRNLVMSDEERRMTAYHEAGHALVALNEPQSDPVHKATILPRGRTLGVMMRLPEGDRHSMSKAKLKAELSVAMAGRVAEELIFGEDNVATGAGGDIKMATNIARAMVAEYGMSPEIGMVDATAGHSSGREIDVAVKNLIDESYARARHLLTADMDALHRIAGGLMEHEILTGEQMLAYKENREPVFADPQPQSAPSAVPATLEKVRGQRHAGEVAHPRPAPGMVGKTGEAFSPSC